MAAPAPFDRHPNAVVTPPLYDKNGKYLGPTPTGRDYGDYMTNDSVKLLHTAIKAGVKVSEDTRENEIFIDPTMGRFFRHIVNEDVKVPAEQEEKFKRAVDLLDQSQTGHPKPSEIKQVFEFLSGQEWSLSVAEQIHSTCMRKYQDAHRDEIRTLRAQARDEAVVQEKLADMMDFGDLINLIARTISLPPRAKMEEQYRPFCRGERISAQEIIHVLCHHEQGRKVPEHEAFETLRLAVPLIEMKDEIFSFPLTAWLDILYKDVPENGAAAQKPADALLPSTDTQDTQPAQNNESEQAMSLDDDE